MTKTKTPYGVKVVTDPDLTPEAVEQLAITLEEINNWGTDTHIKLADKTAATLRALSAELEAEKARAEAAEAKLNEAVKLLVSAETVMQFVLDHEASELDKRLTIKDAMSSQKEIRAFLASLEGDKPDE